MSEEVEINQAPADKAEPEPAVDLQVASGEAVGTGVLFACLSLFDDVWENGPLLAEPSVE